jgi:hypothetical protein
MSSSPSIREISSAGGNNGGNFVSFLPIFYLLSDVYLNYSVEIRPPIISTI